MTVEITRDFLAWCSVINVGILLWWFLWFALAHDLVYRIHSTWFKLPVEKFDTIHYAGMAFYKLCILVFNIIPYLALRIIG